MDACTIWRIVDEISKLAVFCRNTTWDDPVFLFLLLGVFLYRRVAAIPIKESSLNLLPVLPFVLFVLLANIAFWRPPDPATAHQIGYVVPPGTPVIPAIPQYWDTVVFSIDTFLHLFTILSSTLVLIKTVSPAGLALAITKMKVLPEIGMALSLAISDVPVVIGQLVSVMKAQQSKAQKVKPPILSLVFVPMLRSLSYILPFVPGSRSDGCGYDIDHQTGLNQQPLSG